jgi:DNA-binding transcriptional LysR family regulator
MNSLDALAAVAKGGAGIVRVPSWQAESDLAAGDLVRLLAEYEPAPAPFAPDVSTVAAGFAEDQGLPRPSRRALARHRSSRHSPMATDKQNHCSILKPCQMAVVYQAADQLRFIAS